MRIEAIFLAPLAIFAGAFLAIPLAELFLVAGSGPRGAGAYFAIVTDTRYRDSLLVTLGLAALTTLATLALGTIVAQTLGRRRFAGRDVLLGLLTFPDHMLLGLGIMLSATEVPRIAQQFGLDTSAKFNMSSVVHMTSTAVNLTRNLTRAVK